MKRAFSVKYRTTAVHDGPMLPRILLVRIARSVLECAWLATAFSRAARRARLPGYFMPRAVPKAAAPLRAAAALQNLAENGRLVLLLGLLLFALPALGLDWRPIPAGRVAKLPVPREGKTGFTRMPAAALGITFTNRLADERGITNRNLLSGSGVACGDVDGDGWCDLFFCGLDAPNQLYRNLGGWKFTNVTDSAFPAPSPIPHPPSPNDSTGAAFADVDGDGDLDLLVNGLHAGTRLFLNDGHGRFTEATDAAGLRSGTGATSLALADVDGDGDLDLYVCNFRPTTILDRPSADIRVRMAGNRPVVIAVDGRPVTEPDLTNRFEVGPRGEVVESGQPDVLWLNDGKGHFTPVSWTGGAFLDEEGSPLKTAPRDWGLACHFADFNRDGRPDLYVCNDLQSPDRFWVNESADGRVRFRAIARTALRDNSTFSMGVDFGDLDRDGGVDFFTVDMLSRDRAWRQTQLGGMASYARPIGLIDDRVQVRRNALQLNRGDGTFADAAFFGGVEASEWSWGPVFLDVDLDGYEDILISNGQARDFQDSDGAARIEAAQQAARAAGRKLTASDIAALVRTFPRLDTPKVAFRNRGDATFEEVGAAWGFADRTISQGMALADLDNDGDLDVVMNNLQDAPGIYRNETAAPRVLVRLRGAGLNSRGIGARVALRGGPVPEQAQEIIAGGRYLSGDEAVRVFAARGTALQIEVAWPSGRRSLVPDVAADHAYEVAEVAAAAVPVPRSPFPAPRFVDVSSLLDHRHVEEPADDLARQPLLPHKLSQLGPGVTWADLDGDGFDDLLVGTGKSGPLAVFHNDGKGGFTRVNEGAFEKPVGRDMTTVLDAGAALIAGSANWEDGQTNGGAVRLYDLASKASGESILDPGFSVGPLALADVDGDGTLELFLGGRAVAGRWPEAASSSLMKNVGGRFRVMQRFDALGLVSGACFTDIDGDGDPDLVLATEWGPVRVFRNDSGKFTEVTKELGLAPFTGFWNSVTAGDFDGDGRLDLVAGNWGLNTKYRASTDAPRRVWSGDLSGNGGVEIIESWVEPGTGKEWPEREYPLMAQMFPWLRERFPTYAAYARATVPELFGDRLKSAAHLDATWLATTVFMNRGDHFEAHPLPRSAQLAPAFGVCVGDYDGDGAEDIFLAQNWSAAQPTDARDAAGRGLWLRGDGRGGFSADESSGVAVHGDGRGAALADYDADGRVDLVVGQNGAATKLFHNVGAKPGLRVRLAGPAMNPHAIGAAVRLVHGERRGPWRELHAGAGYWSSDSPTLVLGSAGAPTRIEVRWPGGKLTASELPAGATAVSVDPEGRLRPLR